MTCKFAIDWGTDLVFKHHCIHVLHTQYHFPQSKVTKEYSQTVFGKPGTYQYVLVCTMYILVCTGGRTCTFSREKGSILMLEHHNILVTHTVSFTTGQSHIIVCSQSFRKALYRPVHTGMYMWFTCTYSHRSHSHFISDSLPGQHHGNPSNPLTSWQSPYNRVRVWRNN